MSTILNPKPMNDEAFKTVFGDPRHPDNLKRFLSSLGEFPGGEIQSLTISDPFLRRWRWHDKYGILDLRVVTATGTTVNVEVQVCNIGAMIERIIYYLSKLIWQQLKGSDKYGKLKPVVSILICDFEMFKDSKEEYYNRIRHWNEQIKKLFTR
jgi:predicted transposase/invertase (TIGR01784 family)